MATQLRLNNVVTDSHYIQLSRIACLCPHRVAKSGPSHQLRSRLGMPVELGDMAILRQSPLLLVNIDRAKLLSMRQMFSFTLLMGVWLFSMAIQSPHAQSSRPNELQTAVVMSKLAPPRYPSLALQARIQGDVQIAVGVRRDGTVESASITSGHAVLGQAALQSAQNPNMSAGDVVRR